MERPSSVTSKENWRTKGCCKKRLIMYSWYFHSSLVCLTWKWSWTKRLLTNITTGFQVSSYNMYPKNWSTWRHISNRNPSFTLALQYDNQSECLFPKYTLACKTPKLLNRGFEISSAATYFFSWSSHTGLLWPKCSVGKAYVQEIKGASSYPRHLSDCTCLVECNLKQIWTSMRFAEEGMFVKYQKGCGTAWTREETYIASVKNATVCNWWVNSFVFLSSRVAEETHGNMQTCTGLSI